VFVTEATFALPIFRWDPPELVAGEIGAWWDENRARGRASLLLGYATGKAERLLALLADRAPIWVHGAVAAKVAAYREAGVELPEVREVASAPERKGRAWGGELILAPPGWEATPWARRFGDASVALASGWTCVRGYRRQRGLDRGFALSDHADWPDLLRTIADSRARRVLVTHGFVEPLVRWLREHGTDAEPFRAGWVPEERPDARPDAEEAP
jgi:putative mRNA 3-end processing factor